MKVCPHHAVLIGASSVLCSAVHSGIITDTGWCDYIFVYCKYR